MSKVRLRRIKDYPKFLAGMAELAYAPREPDAPTVISTFAGGGGSSTGYHMAGFNELLAVEWDEHASETLRANYPHLDVYHGDVCELTVEEVIRRTGIKVGELDIFDGSPPCQGFSMAGKRDTSDSRNQLFREFCRFLTGLQPKVFVMENVVGMVQGAMKSTFVEILETLDACGYNVACRKLTASYFGVPQARNRLIFIGTRKDLPVVPSHPAPIYVPPTAHEGIRNVENTEEELEDARLKNRWEIFNKWAETKVGKSHHVHFGLHRLHPNRPSPTILKNGGGGSANITHWSEPRYPTKTELLRLGSFPDGYKIEGALSKAFQRVGNSVPPLMIKAVADHIRKEILSKI